MRVEVVRSSRRRKTVELKPIADGVRISIPSSATAEEEARYVRTLLRKYEKRKQTVEIDLHQRALGLSRKFGLEKHESIRWSDQQNSRWGSCTPSTGAIRISTSVAKFPGWVLDYVIVHELAHLSAHGHGPDFWALVNRYPLTERARGFLLAKGPESDDADADVGNEDEVKTDESSFTANDDASTLFDSY